MNDRALQLARQAVLGAGAVGGIVLEVAALNAGNYQQAAEMASAVMTAALAIKYMGEPPAPGGPGNGASSNESTTR